MSRKMALLIANSVYDDKKYGRLQAPKADVKALAQILGDPDVGGFEVLPFLLDKPKEVIETEIERFFNAKEPDDMLLLYFSGHGDISPSHLSRSFYLIAKKTRYQEIMSTGISSDFLKRIMNASKSKQQIVILDCCYAGAFFPGGKARASIPPLLGGSGRVILAAASATQIAEEDLEGVQAEGLSFFTYALVQGLKTGDADQNKDGVIDVDELYQYAYDQVQQVRPDQTPERWVEKQRGVMIIAKNILQPYLSPKLEKALTASHMLVNKRPTKVTLSSQGKGHTNVNYGIQGIVQTDISGGTFTFHSPREKPPEQR